MGLWGQSLARKSTARHVNIYLSEVYGLYFVKSFVCRETVCDVEKRGKGIKQFGFIHTMPFAAVCPDITTK